MNDLEMFGVVDYVIVMENVVLLLKEKVIFVMKDNNSDGIMFGLK